MVKATFVGVAIGAVIACSVGSAGADTPLLNFTFPPTAAPKSTPAPSANEQLREIGRVRVIRICLDERKQAAAALKQTAHSDGVVVGVMKKLGETRWSLDDLSVGGTPPMPNALGGTPGAPNTPAPIPFTTPIPVFEVAQEGGKPYWAGTRKILDASGDLEKSVKAAAAYVDRLQRLANSDPDPARRTALQKTISALSDAIIAQARMVGPMTEFAVRADTLLSSQEMYAAGQMQGANSDTATGGGELTSGSAQQLKIKLSAQTTGVHEATVKAVEQTQETNRTAFTACP
ncbi:MAG: hypothetical protein JO101_12560 [Candidatus Eremiobacteraeota bacterium]|nr:hypothetical protein [Candidatus Eremiobacteraeota bacterium]